MYGLCIISVCKYEENIQKFNELIKTCKYPVLKVYESVQFIEYELEIDDVLRLDTSNIDMFVG